MRIIKIVLLLTTLVLCCGCQKKVAPPPVIDATNTEFSTPQNAKYNEPKDDSSNMRNDLRTIYFDFDKYYLRKDASVNMQHNAAIIEQYPSQQIIIEGHCDERGTNAYNLSLGMKRAQKTKDYLVARGIMASHIGIVSLGEEQLVCMGHDENCWQRNRRAIFRIGEYKSKP